MDSDTFNLFSFLVIFLLLFLNAFFVAAEFALVKVRPTKIEKILKENPKNKRAKTVKKVLDRLDTHLAAAQVGITLTSLGIGAVAEPSIAKIVEVAVHGVFENASAGFIHTTSFIIAFTIATYLHITVGEQVPKMLAIEKSETISLWTAMPLYFFCKIVHIPIKFLKLSTDVMLLPFGVKTSNEHEVHSAEEIKMMLSTTPDLEPDEQKMLSKIFDFHDRFIREVMVHRKDMECIYLTDPIEETLDMIRNSNYSRFPVCGEDRDDIKGYVTVKDLYKLKNETVDLNNVMREVPKIYETTSIKRALNQLQDDKHQIAIVIDEYGGVSGLVTIEDIVEEVVGDIQDEFDEESEDFTQTKDAIIVDAGVLIDEVNNELQMELGEIDGVDTIGGYIISKIDHAPKVGQIIDLEDYEVKILEMEDHRINLVEFKKIKRNKEDEQEKEIKINTISEE